VYFENFDRIFLTENYRRIGIEKKILKNRYPKLTFFKVWILFYKSDEISEVISKILPKIFKDSSMGIFENSVKF